jgi:hypothetical protein
MIFSIGVRHRTSRNVEFVCPRCGLDRAGAEVVPGRWACLVGIPLIPLGEHDPLVVCDECGHTSDLGVLDVPTTTQLSALLRDATTGALVLAVRAAHGRHADQARDAAMVALCVAGFEDDADRFDAELAELPAADAHRHLARIGPELTAHGKQGFLHRVVAVACGSEQMSAAQRDALARIGCDLGMAAPHINGVLAAASAAA